MAKENIIEVKDEDLNLVDKMNGQGRAQAKDGDPVVNIELDDSDGILKGALGAYGGSFSTYDEIMFIQGERRKIFEYQVEQFEYENLPAGLTKYRLEEKLIESGAVAVYKLDGQYYALNFVTLDWNIWNEPTKIKIIEPKSTTFDGKIYNLQTNDKIMMIRNNVKRVSIFPEVYRILSDLERILFQLEKNITAAMPKGIVNPKNNDLSWAGANESPMKSGLEAMAGSQDTFFQFKPKKKGEDDIENDNEEPVFIPVELKDMAESLIRQFIFFKELLKEKMGAAVASLNPKKARLTSDETGTEQGTAISTKQHAYNVRRTDIELFNDNFGTNIEIGIQVDELPDSTSDYQTEAQKAQAALEAAKAKEKP